MIKPFGGYPRLSAPFAIIFFLLMIASTVYAGGRREDTLSKVDQLIASRLYNEAIVELTAFIKQNPDRFDDAQRRLQRIVRLRDSYNLTASELLKVLVDEPGNNEKKLTLIRRLEELEAAPNRAAREFISKTKATALFTFNASQFDRIMKEGRALIDQGSFAMATRKYSEGFVLYKEEFDTSSYGPLVVSRVDDNLRAINERVTRFGSLVERLNASVNAFEKTYAAAQGEAGIPESTAAFDSLESTFLEFASLRNAVTAAGRSFENQFLLLQGADKALTDSSFLPFAFRFVLGRKTEILPEGIMGSMDTLWIALANRVQTAAVAAADKAYAMALSSRSAGDRNAARSAFVATASYAELASRTVGLWAAVVGAEVSPALTNYGRSIVGGKPQIALRYRSLARLAKHAAQTEALAGELSTSSTKADLAPEAYRSGVAVAFTATETIRADRRAFIDLAGRVAAQIDQVGVYSDFLADYATRGLVGPETISYASDLKNSLDELSRAVFARETTSAAEQYRIALTEIERDAEKNVAEMEKGKVLQNGTLAAEGAPLLKYPSESIPFFTRVEEASTQVLGAMNVLLSGLGAENARIVSDARLTAVASGARSSGVAATELRTAARTALAAARENVRVAENARQEGERRLTEARAALGRQNFDLARERLQRAGERFDFSLSIQESASLRADRDRRLLALSAEITKTENEVVVRDVRRLITSGRQLYYDGVFDKAEDSLLQAQNRWKTTNVTDEPEVSYWLTIVRGALSIKTGRDIPSTAPLFAEMSQLLSFALQYFEEGRELLSARKKTEALRKFDAASKKIQEVKIIFPINRDASLLSLRIEQLTDPETFNASFRRKINDAQAKIKDRPQEAYSELQDLAVINPRFPGLRAIIEKFEIDTGLRKPPPDRAALARSGELTTAARRIVDANLRGQFPVALEQLNEALKLNPSNEQAVSLKDRIQVDVGGQASVVLTNTAERDYQRAVQELQKGNTIVALAIVEQLLRDSQNRNSPRILELQRRIQSRL
ncbi:MAG: hypothetical protein WCT14_05400 [Treponemataceae bacterium]